METNPEYYLNDDFHKPVLVQEVVKYLNVHAAGTYVDATFGGGGHTRAILEANNTATVIALDWDAVALEVRGIPLQEQFPERLQLIWTNFVYIDRQLKKLGIEKVDGILADFGTSFYQLTQRPGFSFYRDTLLDMRMSPAHQKVTAAEIVNKASQEKIKTILQEYGQEPKAALIARVIVEQRQKNPIKTTKQLAQLIERLLKWKKRGIHPATRTFQALRVYVNKELENINAFLNASLRVLKPGGRLVCISFHSLEDGIVKKFFKQSSHGPDSTIDIITPKVIIPSIQEIKENPSARSAKLRAVERKKIIANKFDKRG